MELGREIAQSLYLVALMTVASGTVLGVGLVAIRMLG